MFYNGENLDFPLNANALFETERGNAFVFSSNKIALGFAKERRLSGQRRTDQIPFIVRAESGYNTETDKYRGCREKDNNGEHRAHERPI